MSNTLFEWTEETETQHFWTANQCGPKGKVLWEARIEHDEDSNAWTWWVAIDEGAYVVEGSGPECHLTDEAGNDIGVEDMGFAQCKTMVDVVLWQMGAWVKGMPGRRRDFTEEPA